MDGFSLILAVCRIASLAIAVIVIGLAFSQVTQSWRDDATMETLAPAAAEAPAPGAARAEAAPPETWPPETWPPETWPPETWPIAVERLGTPPELEDPALAVTLGPSPVVASPDTPEETAPPSPQPVPRARSAQRGARPPATRSAWWPTWLRWPAHGSSAGIPPARDSGGGAGAHR